MFQLELERSVRTDGFLFIHLWAYLSAATYFRAQARVLIFLSVLFIYFICTLERDGGVYLFVEVDFVYVIFLLFPWQCLFLFYLEAGAVHFMVILWKEMTFIFSTFFYFSCYFFIGVRCKYFLSSVHQLFTFLLKNSSMHGVIVAYKWH